MLSHSKVVSVSDPPRVAMDVGFAARHSFMTSQTSGIGRAIEELICQFDQRSDIHTSVIGLCNFDNDLFLSSYFTDWYHLNVRCDTTPKKGYLQSLPAVKSRFGFAPFYPRLAAAYAGIMLGSARQEAAKMEGMAFRPVVPPAFLRLLVKSLKVLDVRPTFDPKSFDVFFSTYLPLPPKSITGNIPRVIHIFDLIPILQPDLTNSVQKGELQRIVDSIDPANDWIICNSHSVRQDICRHIGVPSERVVVVPLAAAEHFSPQTDAKEMDAVREKYSIPAGPFLLSVAAWQPRKNIPRLIESFFSLLEQHPELNAHLVLVGNAGSDGISILNSVEESRFKDRLVFTGFVPERDISTLYSAASAFVFPSLAEGFGLPPLEAMCCGTPVVCSNATSLPEVVGDAALMVDPTSIPDLSQALWRVLTDKDLRNELQLKAKERARGFSWSLYSDGVAECLKRAASGGTSI